MIFELAPEGGSTGFTLSLRAKPALGPLGRCSPALMEGQVARDNRKSVENFAALAARELQS